MLKSLNCDFCDRGNNSRANLRCDVHELLDCAHAILQSPRVRPRHLSLGAAAKAECAAQPKSSLWEPSRTNSNRSEVGFR